MPRWVFLGLASLAALVRLIPDARTVDDAFITFRYSRNLVEGLGFVYNPSEAILGTTTPLYALLMALCGALFGGDYPRYALVVNALVDGVGVVLLAWLALRLTRHAWLAVWVGVAWALAPYSVTFAIGGMETSLHNTLMLGAWAAYLAERPRFLGAACALGVMTRPDALIWALPLLAVALWRQKSIPWATWLTGLVLILPWVVFAALYFGSPLPHTISTKAAVYDLPSTQALTLLLQHYATPFGAFTRYEIMLGIVLFPTLALIGWRTTPRALPIFAYPWLYFGVFALANPLIFRWYLAPPLPAYFLAIGCGVAALVALLPRGGGRRGVAVAAAGFALLTTLNAWEWRQPRMAFHDLEQNYARMAGILRAEHGLTTSSVLAASDIGALGFYSRAHIFDTIGLVTRGTTPYYTATPRTPGSNYVIPPDLILDRQPDFVVVMEIFIRDGLAQDPRFVAQYELVEAIPTDYYGTGMLAFKRREN